MQARWMRVAAGLLETLVPPRGDRHGPLTPLLVVLTAVTGIVDAVSYLRLGHVFIANMTGNVVFVGFALAGARDVSLVAASIALAASIAGAVAGGRLAVHVGAHRARLLRDASFVQIAVVGAALAVAIAAPGGEEPARLALVVLLAVAMGVQTAVARRIGVPDLTTTVLTLTITGLAADSPIAGRAPSRPGRRLIGVLAMLAGAALGGVLLIHAGIVAALASALALLVVVGGSAWRLSASQAAWTAPPG